jgi:DNA topoisomerase IA
MEKYTEAELKLIAFEAEDVITASDVDSEGDLII